MLEEKLQNILYTFRSKDVNMENNLSLSLNCKARDYAYGLPDLELQL